MLFHRRRQSDRRVENAEGLFLDGQFLGRRTVAALCQDQRRALSALGRNLERAATGQGSNRKSRHGLPQLLFVGAWLSSDKRSEVSRRRTASCGTSEADLQSDDVPGGRLGSKRR